MKFLIFGNQLVKQDNLPFQLIPQLKQSFPSIEFITADPIEDLHSYGRDLNIIDVEITTPEVREIILKTKEDFEKIQLSKLYSMHDFDLGYNLKLLKKINKIDTVRIICVPSKANKQEVFNQIKSIFLSCKNFN